MDKRRKVYDSDGIVVEAVETPQPQTQPRKKSNLRVNLSETATVGDGVANGKTIKVIDVLDAFAGYLPPRVNFMDSGEGNCVICGERTSSPMRKFCFDCLQKHGQTIHTKAIEAIATGKLDFPW